MWRRGPRFSAIVCAILKPAVAGWLGWCSASQVDAADDVAQPAGAAQPAVLNFEDDIVPSFEARCFKCHGAETRKAGLDLRRQFTLIRGGDSGPAVVPGKPDESSLIEMIEKKEMPPKDEDPLEARQIEL